MKIASESAGLRSVGRSQANSVWRELWRRQTTGMEHKLSRTFVAGLELLSPRGLDGTRLPDQQRLSNALYELSGWRIEEVPGLIPVRDFFGLLRERRFPAPSWIRAPFHLEYTPEPDAFHDLFGHLPQLVRPEFSLLFEDLAQRAWNASDQELERIERVYWYTIEYGLTLEAGALRAIGAGLASSLGELDHALYGKPVERHSFELQRVQMQAFQTDRQQDLYFVCSSIESIGISLLEIP